jgi:hypothetical protein
MMPTSLAVRAAYEQLRADLTAPDTLPAFDPAWLRWNNGAVLGIARSIYATHAFSGIALLADSLEEAGCSDATVLSHLRANRPHARGCFVLDTILKEGAP